MKTKRVLDLLSALLLFCAGAPPWAFGGIAKQGGVRIPLYVGFAFLDGGRQRKLSHDFEQLEAQRDDLRHAANTHH